MKILFLTKYLGSAFGTERATAETIRQLRIQGHFVAVVGPETSSETPEVDALEMISGLDLASSRAFRTDQRQIFKKALDTINRLSPDVVVLAEMFSPRLIIPICKKYPTVFTAHSLSPTCPASNRRREGLGPCQRVAGLSCLVADQICPCLNFRALPAKAYATLDNLRLAKAIRRATRTVIPSHALKNYFVLNSWPAQSIDVVYHTVSLSHEPERRLTHGRPIIVSTSRFDPIKGLDIAIRAMALLSENEAELWLIGTGDGMKSAQALCAQLKVQNRIRFLGKKTYSETHRLLQQASVFIQPNIGIEAFGMGIAEAMLTGLPIVASDIPAMNELVRHGETGILVPPGSPDALAYGIREILETPELAARLSISARDSAETLFSATVHGNRFVESLQKAYDEFHRS